MARLLRQIVFCPCFENPEKAAGWRNRILLWVPGALWLKSGLEGPADPESTIFITEADAEAGARLKKAGWKETMKTLLCGGSGTDQGTADFWKQPGARTPWALINPSAGKRDFLSALESLELGRISFPAALPPVKKAPDMLTSREAEVLSLAARGFSNNELAMILGISPNTVKFHLKEIFLKLGVAARAEAVAVALQEGIILI